MNLAEGEQDVSEEFDKEDLEDPLEGEEPAKNQPKDKNETGDDNAVDMEGNILLRALPEFPGWGGGVLFQKIR